MGSSSRPGMDRVRWKFEAGIYECYEEGKRETVSAVFRLIVRKCSKNLYGENCDQKCPVCYNGGICHDTIGVCVCPPGFTGSNCEVACGESHIGGECGDVCRGHDCVGLFFCKQDPYGCSCAPGFTHFTCYQKCDPGWYGADCKQPCHCAAGPESCNRFTGACSGGCSLGWTGQSCQIEVVD